MPLQSDAADASLLRGRVGQTPHEYKKIDMTLRDLLIRDEKKTDYGAISEVTIAAFEKMEISNHAEQFIIEILTVRSSPNPV